MKESRSMAIQITTDPTQYGSGATDDEGRRIAAYIVKMAGAYIAANALAADVRATDSTGALNTSLSDDEQRVEDYIEANWIDWLPAALSDDPD
jgi:hypothetical protein